MFAHSQKHLGNVAVARDRKLASSLATRTLAIGFALLTICGCDEGPGDEEPLALTGSPVALDEKLLLISSEGRTAYLLDVVDASEASATRVRLPTGAQGVERRLGGHDEALVVCSGQRDSADSEAEPASLSVVNGEGSVRTYELGASPFNSLVQSDDGRYAVLFRSGEQRGRTLQNVNELVVVDLDANPSAPEAVTSKTPDGLGHAFTRAVISPEMLVAGEMRRLLVLLSDAEVTLFDLNHLERRGTIVELAGANAVAPRPEQVVFGAPEPILYVRGADANDVYVFRLEPRSSSDDLNDFRPTINPLGAGGRATDIALVGQGGAQRVLIVSTDSGARLVDPSSGGVQFVGLPWAAERIRLFDAAAPNDGDVRTRALLYSSTMDAVTFMELEGLDDRPERKLETVTLSAPVLRIIELDDPDTVVLTHQQGVTLLNLTQRTATPISANGSLDGALFDPVQKRLWVSSLGEPWLGTLDLDGGKIGEVRLDDPVRKLVPFFEQGRLAVMHESSIGYVTLLDTDDPSRKKAESIRGFLLAGALDEGE